MAFGSRMRPLGLALAAIAAAGGGALAADAGGFVAPAPTPFAPPPLPPLIESRDARASDPLAPIRSVDPFVLAPRLQDDTGPSLRLSVNSPPLEPAPTPDADPVRNVLAAALARFILHDARVNPIGDGDWQGAKAAIGAFYAARGFRPVWVDADGWTAAGRSAAAGLARASDDGLNLKGFAPPRDLAGPLDPQALAEAEIAVAAGVVAYAEQASGARLAIGRFSPILAARPNVADSGEALEETAAAADPGARLAAFNPPHRGYRALREALAQTEEALERAAPHYDAATLARAVVSDAPATGDDPLIAAAVHARATPGRRGADLASATPDRARSALERRRAVILANMEMWRFEPRDMGERRIEVNIPDYSVTMRDRDAVLMTSRAVVGKPDTPTPVFSNLMRYVLINPSWSVPDSIVKKEILPRLDHFLARGYEVKTVGGRTIVRQPPGDDNALGRLAFMFPNDHSVYLHDTPARRLFAEQKRALSHGCVRVEEPRRLAELVLGWPAARLDKAIGGAERTVFLAEPLPVHIEYFTAFVDEDGGLAERPDVYGLMQRIASMLAPSRQD